MLRFMGITFLLAAAAALVADWLDAETWREIGFASLDQRWRQVHAPSREAVQSAAESTLGSEVWSQNLDPLLAVPAVVALGVLALIFLGLRKLL